jgi:hypothetical protein
MANYLEDSHKGVLDHQCPRRIAFWTAKSAKFWAFSEHRRETCT